MECSIEIFNVLIFIGLMEKLHLKIAQNILTSQYLNIPIHQFRVMLLNYWNPLVI